MKIYTKTGDKGKTSLYGGRRVAKFDERVEAYGTLDELNSYIGIIVAKSEIAELNKSLNRIQKELFDVGADIATPHDINQKLKQVRVTDKEVNLLENEIDDWQENLPPLTNFILPGGSEVGSMLHHARVICRRAERRLVLAAEKFEISENAIKYLNRLSDWFFVLARTINKEQNKSEVIWES